MKLLKMIPLLVILLLLEVISVGAAEKKWSDEGELSSVNTGGNTNVSTFAAKNIVKYKFSEKIEGNWKVSALNSKTEGIKTAERYASELRGDHLFSEHIYAGLSVGWLKDKFAGIDARYYVGPVAGYRVLHGPKHFLKTEAGLDYVSEDYTNNTSSNFLRGRAFGAYEFHLTDLNKFTQSLEYLYDFDNATNYNINTVSAMVTVLSQNFSLKTSYEVKFDNDPIGARLNKKTDTMLAVSLLVNF
ncbi:hypothetical protein MNBD_NITROSPIRAE01-190 [hydrothermal vent metagenome]|uniref:Salt-induced outer membrane protein n=1 Tax=hydrothermal vent metagenome TaxID=652676 RepID=A0A3B1D784_9ZZZZ